MTDVKKNRPSGLVYKKQNVFMQDVFKLYKIWVAANRPKQTRFATMLHKEHGYPKAKNLTGLLNRFAQIEEMK
ncbi:hypothetical protein Q9X96_003120 [Vibrio vulnificus]|nr:hypothetical protein [Vibrio vulnificus]